MGPAICWLAIIGILSSVVLASLNTAREKAKVANSIAQVRELRTVVVLYQTDTGSVPPACELDCTALTDPYLNALGASGWHGPYLSGGVWNLTHPWGGHFTISQGDVTGDGVPELYFFLDEDAPGTDYNNNTGVIPTEALLAIDRALDDGDLSTGSIRGNNLGYAAALGELVFIPAL
jgi:type II secretory pathway pseudopilin PulG